GLPVLALLWALTALTAVILARAAARKLGGLPGDLVGAVVELTEVVVLFAGAVLSGLLPPFAGVER
ncbi:MAG: adenosylcobinamide-GDP ribazoletransferase, partial [Firmicutes bacterium]|nr:adenosylcobinamide-GDP ribazoletransferase [Bacillota bacterium]